MSYYTLLCVCALCLIDACLWLWNYEHVFKIAQKTAVIIVTDHCRSCRVILYRWQCLTCLWMWLFSVGLERKLQLAQTWAMLLIHKKHKCYCGERLCPNNSDTDHVHAFFPSFGKFILCGLDVQSNSFIVKISNQKHAYVCGEMQSRSIFALECQGILINSVDTLQSTASKAHIWWVCCQQLYLVATRYKSTEWSQDKLSCKVCFRSILSPTISHIEYSIKYFSIYQKSAQIQLFHCKQSIKPQ